MVDLSVDFGKGLKFKNQYDKLGMDVRKHPGLYRLFNDEAFKQSVIKTTQENYRITYQQVMANHK